VSTANFIAIDLGASSGRVVLGRWNGKTFDLQVAHRFANEPVGIMDHIYWDVLRLWFEVKKGIAACVAAADSPISGIGVDAWGVDYALLDRRGHLLGNPCHYRDNRTQGMIERACEVLPKQQIYQRTGIQFMPINTLTQLLSMVEARDPQLEHAATLLMMPDLFHYWLTGEKIAEYTVASTSQMLDAGSRAWATGLLEILAIPISLLPRIVLPGTVLGKLRAEVTTEVGASEAVPVIAGGSHDTASAVAAIPELDEQSVYLSSGTWSLMGVEIDKPVISEEALKLNVTNEGGVGGRIRLLKNVAGLWLLEESRRQWRREEKEYSWEELITLAAQATPFRSIIDPDAVDFLGPGDIPGRIRAYCRRNNQPEPDSVGAVVRCCLESLALRYRWVVEALESVTGQAYSTVRVVGGGSKNRLLNQFTADACERPVVAGPVEATALGNVMMQAVATGLLPDLETGREAVAASVVRQQFEPHPDSAWLAAYRKFCSLLT